MFLIKNLENSEKATEKTKDINNDLYLSLKIDSFGLPWWRSG